MVPLLSNRYPTRHQSRGQNPTPHSAPSNCLFSLFSEVKILPMAPKRLPQDPPAASSMEEDDDPDTETIDEDEEQNDAVEAEVEDDEEEEEDDDEEEDVKAIVISNRQSDSSSEDDAADSGTESDDINHSPSASDFTVKPIVSNPLTNSSAAKPKKPTPAAPAKPSSGAKRAAESDSNPKDSKKKKPANSGGEDDESRKGRLWSEEDEIAIFTGMIDFKAKRGVAASSNMELFHEFVKDRLKPEVRTSQLMDKARRLKKRYLTENENVFSKPHEVKLFQLAKRIWGVGASGGDESVKNSKKKPRKSAVKAAANDSSNTVLALPVSEVNVVNGGIEAELDEFWSKYPALSNSLQLGNCSLWWEEGLEKVMMQKMPSIGSAKAKELDDKWRKLQDTEMELSVKKMELSAKKLQLLHEQSKLVMDVSRKD